MLARVIIFTAALGLLAPAAQAEPPRQAQCLASERQHAASAPADVCRPPHPLHETAPTGNDIAPAQTPGVHGRILIQIAVYHSIGNREGVEILTSQLRALGVGSDAVAETINWAKLHASARQGSPPGARHMELAPVEPGWAASQ